MYTTKQRVTNHLGSSRRERKASEWRGQTEKEIEKDSVGSNNSESKRSIKH